MSSPSFTFLFKSQLTMSTFSSIEDRFDRSLFIVTGYMHDNGNRDFLLDLIKVITTYYNRSDEWCSKHKGKNMKILEGSNGTKMCKDNDGSRNFECIFGTEVIIKGKYEWKLRVNKLTYPTDTFFHILVGVINTNKADMSSMYHRDPATHGCYTFDVTLGEIVNQTNVEQQFTTKVTKSGDIIDVTFDFENKTLYCFINGTDIGTSIKNLQDGEYRLLVCLFFEENELELL